MNIETGKIYRDPDEIAAARARGEVLTPVSDHVAQAQEIGHRILNRKARRTLAKLEKERKGIDAKIASLTKGRAEAITPMLALLRCGGTHSIRTRCD